MRKNFEALSGSNPHQALKFWESEERRPELAAMLKCAEEKNYEQLRALYQQWWEKE